MHSIRSTLQPMSGVSVCTFREFRAASPSHYHFRIGSVLAHSFIFTSYDFLVFSKRKPHL